MILAPPRAGLFFVSSDADFEWCDGVTGDRLHFFMLCLPQTQASGNVENSLSKPQPTF